MSRPPIELHIDELVLHGFAPADGHRIADAVQTELTRLIAERGVAGVRASHDVAVVSAGSVRLRRGAPARTVGVQVARALHSAVRR